MRPHGLVTEAAELMAWHRVFAGQSEARAHLRDEARDHHGVDVGVGDEKAVHDIGAGDAERHRCGGRHSNAAWHELVLLGDDPHHDGTIGLDGAAEIALDKLAMEMERLRVDDLDIAGWMQRPVDAGRDNDRHHDGEHDRHDQEPALLGAGDDLRRDDAVRQRPKQRI